MLAIASVWFADRRTKAPLGLDRRGAPALCWIVAAVSFWLVSTQLGVAVNYALFTERDEMVVHNHIRFTEETPGLEREQLGIIVQRRVKVLQKEPVSQGNVGDAGRAAQCLVIAHG